LTDPCTYKSLSFELLNCKITDTLNNITHQEGKVNLKHSLKHNADNQSKQNTSTDNTLTTATRQIYSDHFK